MSRNLSSHISDDSGSVRRKSLVRGFLLFGIVWVIVAGWSPTSLVVGLPTTLLAGFLYTSTQNGTIVFPSVIPLLRFLPYFLWESLLSGVDIALRVLSPRVRVAPGIFAYKTTLKREGARVFFANTVSLTPGTLSVMFEGDCLHVHTFDVHQPNQENLRRLEMLVAALFREAGSNPTETI